MAPTRSALKDGELRQLLPGGQGGWLYLLLTKGDALICEASADGSIGAAIGQGDVGGETQAVLHALAKKRRLFVAEANVDSVEAAPARPPGRAVTGAELRALFKRSEVAAFGRAGTLDSSTAEVVRRRAAWRCQFEGCAADLSEHAATGTAGNFSYLAHIVAASPDGPRGHPTESARLVNDPENILLLCDRCHRLIDRVDPGKYTVAYLRAMRQRSVAQVKAVLDGLAFPAYHVLQVMGSVAGQMAALDRREAYDAMRKMRMRPVGDPYTFLQGPIDQPDNTSTAHWQAQAESLEREVSALQAWLSGASQGGHATERLAVFPLHNMSKLILAGRIVGEARTVRLLQFRRDDASGDVQQWSWPDGVQAPSQDAFQTYMAAKATSGTEGVLLFCLTALLAAEELPPALAGLPRWTITARSPHRGVINHPQCLDVVAQHIEAVLVDAERRGIRRLHLFPIAPASVCFRFGQKLQARHHVNVTVYERGPKRAGDMPQMFVRTIEIIPGAVNLGGDVSIRI